MSLVAPFDPTLHLRVFVGGVVVDDEVEGQAGGCLFFEMFDEVQPFLVGVAPGSLAEYFPVQITQRREEREGGLPTRQPPYSLPPPLP